MCMRLLIGFDDKGIATHAPGVVEHEIQGVTVEQCSTSVGPNVFTWATDATLVGGG